MKRRNYTREILNEMAKGRQPFNSVGPEGPVTYEPRSKYDPQPFTNGAYRYSGREVYTRRPANCDRTMLNVKTLRLAPCAKPLGHEGAHSSKADV